MYSPFRLTCTSALVLALSLVAAAAASVAADELPFAGGEAFEVAETANTSDPAAAQSGATEAPVYDEPERPRGVPAESSGAQPNPLSADALMSRLSNLLVEVECGPTSLALETEIGDRTEELQSAETLASSLRQYADQLDELIVGLARDVAAVHQGERDELDALINARTITPARRALTARAQAEAWEAHSVALRGYLQQLTVDEVLHDRTCSSEVAIGDRDLRSPPALPTGGFGAAPAPQPDDPAAAAHRDELLREAGLR